MRISELAARTDLPVGTIKYYLRESLLPPGLRTSRTAAEYDDSHVERLRLVRALTDAGGLGIAGVRRILSVIDAPEPARLYLLATAEEALLREERRQDRVTAEVGTRGPGGAGAVRSADDAEGARTVDDEGRCAADGEDRCSQGSPE